MTPPAAQSLIEWTVDWAWISRHAGRIAGQLGEHLAITGLSVGIGFAVSLLLAVVAYRRQGARRWILTASSVLFTIPSFALILLLVPFTGLTRTTVVLPLVLYTLMALVRNTVEGLESVPSEVREAAVAMGYRRSRMLREIELPMALPVIVAGLRIATVTTVGLVTIGGLIGIGGLGNYIFDGLRRSFLTPLLVGALGSLALALLLDALLLALQRALTPWSRRAEGL